jgi:hypothetical protein
MVPEIDDDLEGLGMNISDAESEDVPGILGDPSAMLEEQRRLKEFGVSGKVW